MLIKKQAKKTKKESSRFHKLRQIKIKLSAVCALDRLWNFVGITTYKRVRNALCTLRVIAAHVGIKETSFSEISGKNFSSLYLLQTFTQNFTQRLINETQRMRFYRKVAKFLRNSYSDGTNLIWGVGVK